MTLSTTVDKVADAEGTAKKKTLFAACTAHATHDGLSDLVYVLLPVWQEMFMLSYVWLSVLRSAYALTLAALQIPASSLTIRMKPAYVLSAATAITAVGWLAAGFTGSALALGAALVIAGMGASAQHPVASAMVSRAYAGNAKRPLGVYNFAGDVGKSLLPASAALLLTFTTFHITTMVFAGLGLLSAALIWVLLKDVTPRAVTAQKASASRPAETGGDAGPGAFRVLLSTAVLDSAVRMGFLTFLPFIIKSNGGSLPQAGLALTLVFIGGAVGKFVCGWMSDTLGTVNTILVTELATALLIVVVLVSPLPVGLIALPFLGAVLNGTSSVLYGAVTEVVESNHLEKAFSVFYTGTIGSGALAPVLYGFAGDHTGLTSAAVIVAATALLSALPVWLYSLRHPRIFQS